MNKICLNLKEGLLPKVMLTIGLVSLLLVFLTSCISIDKSVSFRDFVDNPDLRDRFVGSWQAESRNEKNYGITTFNTDGSLNETMFNNNHKVLMTTGGMYKLSSTQIIIRTTNKKEGVWNYHFLDNDTFSISSGNMHFLYHRRTD